MLLSELFGDELSRTPDADALFLEMAQMVWTKKKEQIIREVRRPATGPKIKTRFHIVNKDKKND